MEGRLLVSKILEAGVRLQLQVEELVNLQSQNWKKRSSDLKDWLSKHVIQSENQIDSMDF